MTTSLRILIPILAIAYPVAVYFALQYVEAKFIALGLIALVLLRALFSRSLLAKNNLQITIVVAFIGVLLGGISFFSNSSIGIKLYPALTSLAFLAVFSISLLQPTNIIERIARIKEPNLSPRGVSYTLSVTKIWCVFFIVNAIASLYTTFYGSMESWTLYNGLISYLLMGFIFSAEFIYRTFIHKRNVSHG